MRIIFIWVFLLSYSISHLESCMLSAVLFKDLCLSEEVPFIFYSFSEWYVWTFKHKAIFFHLYYSWHVKSAWSTNNCARNKAFVFHFFLFYLCLDFLLWVWIKGLTANFMENQHIAQDFTFLWNLQDSYKEPFPFFVRAAAVLINHVACESGFGVMKSLGLEELCICKSPQAPVFCYKLPWLFKA